jgi:hypothetical protein
MTDETVQPLPTAIERLLAPYPDLLEQLRTHVREAIREASVTPCVDRVIWTIKDSLDAMMVSARAEAEQATHDGHPDIAIAHDERRKALMLAGSDGNGMNDYLAIQQIAGRSCHPV